VGQNLASNQEVKPVNEPSSKEMVKAAIVLPDWLPLDTWREFEGMRKGIKSPMTPFAAQLVIKKLDRFRQDGHDVQKALEQSIVNSWKDVYEPKPQKQQGKAFETQGDRNAKVMSGLTRGLIGGGSNVKLLGN
jgi:hypothetical protein